MPFMFEESDDPNLQLSSFLDQLSGFLQTLLFDDAPYGYRILFIDDMRDRLRLAYETETLPHFDRVRAVVQDTPPEVFARVGLIGNSLQAKLAALFSLGRRFRDGIVDALRYLLAQINSLLGSISAATGGIADLISEFKDMVENCIDYVEQG
ncbi:hypothetical protein QTA57_08530 [Fontisubflavum oceani]|uniref:hypothetical protein n=1 Tax=Fontisubflavum oceani TaxID=2978973 RepID=UPI0025B3F2CD|nr:hypothetical protein [Fontisubflavum oceani]WJY23101.1 hypothetical protein QTA57_08530 [Fontisubflavum oceani]